MQILEKLLIIVIQLLFISTQLLAFITNSWSIQPAFSIVSGEDVYKIPKNKFFQNKTSEFSDHTQNFLKLLEKLILLSGGADN